MRTKIGILLRIYVIAVAFIGTDLNPLLLISRYQNFVNAILPQIHMTLIFLMIPAAGLAQHFLRNSQDTKA